MLEVHHMINSLADGGLENWDGGKKLLWQSWPDLFNQFGKYSNMVMEINVTYTEGRSSNVYALT